MAATKKYRFILSGGGTGGHLFPAVSIAREILRRFPDAEILFVGAEGRMEMTRVPEAGFRIEGLPIAGLQRRLTAKNLLLSVKILKSLSKAFEIINRFKPDAVIGTGGYASAPVVWAAQFKKIPTFIQEQNSYPGLTNRFLARKAVKVFTAYPGADKYFPRGKTLLTGNPVRKDIIRLPSEPEALRHFGLREDKPVILVLGGSLGAAAINRAVASVVESGALPQVQWLWQTGKNYYDRYKAMANDNVKILPFIKEMNKAYSAADIVISRAGAGTLSELAVAGKPAVLIPSVNVAEDHQTKNARALSEKNAAVLLPEPETDRLADVLKELIYQPEKREELARNIRSLAKPDATEKIVEVIKKHLE